MKHQGQTTSDQISTRIGATIEGMTTPGDTSATFCFTLVDEWIRNGVQHAVVSPGSRSTPLAVALSARAEMSVHVFHDERSASFAALGIGLQSGHPAVLLCTSGTAAAHFHGAVAEADLSNVPMIVCTADRPPELLDVGAPQTINQSHLYGSKVRWFHDPGVPSTDARHTWRSLAARCVRLSTQSRPGPVHLNLPFREPLLGTPGELPPPRNTEWSQTFEGAALGDAQLDAVAGLLSGTRGIVVAGKGSTPALLSLARSLGWPVFADARSGMRIDDDNVILASDAIVRSAAFAHAHAPAVVLRVGEPPASKVVNQWLSHVWPRLVQLQKYNNVVDPDHQVSANVVGDVELIAQALASRVTSVDEAWLASWKRAERAAQQAITDWTRGNASEPSNARKITQAIPGHSNLVVSSSMPIRDIEWFGTITPNVNVFSNRGANGIDGVTSTAVGIALASRTPTFVYIGDVAVIHDANGLLGLAQRDVDVRVIVSNNDGGSIFSFLPQATQVDVGTFELLYGTPHGVSFESLAKAFGVAYHRVGGHDDLEQAMLTSGSRLIELVTDRNTNVSLHAALNEAVIAAVEAATA